MRRRWFLGQVLEVPSEVVEEEVGRSAGECRLDREELSNTSNRRRLVLDRPCEIDDDGTEDEVGVISYCSQMTSQLLSRETGTVNSQNPNNASFAMVATTALGSPTKSVIPIKAFAMNSVTTACVPIPLDLRRIAVPPVESIESFGRSESGRICLSVSELVLLVPSQPSSTSARRTSGGKVLPNSSLGSSRPSDAT